jgi:agmatine/peptidylarginine deiminase
MSKNQIILPAEWVEQDFVQLTWAHIDSDWADMLDEVEVCFVEIAREISKRENLLIVCQSKRELRERLHKINTSRITFVELPSNDTWARDHGGITIFENDKRKILDFTFNGWGMKFAANFDNQITRQLFQKGIFGKNTIYENRKDFVLEGGSIESDGEGTLLTTVECLLSDNRNNKSKEEIEHILKETFGLKQILWLHHGYLAGDDTDSHIDTLARFCTPHIIAYVQCTDKEDEHYAALKKMEEELQNFHRLDGKPYQLLPLPMADAVYENDERLPATYANFLIMNDAVLLPTYNSPKDEIAKRQLQKAFPNREIIGINCLALIKQHGSLHCVTMQYPKLNID